MGSYLAVSKKGESFNVVFYSSKEYAAKQNDENDLISCNSRITHILRNIFGTLLCGLIDKSDSYTIDGFTHYLSRGIVKTWEENHNKANLHNIFNQFKKSNVGSSNTTIF